MLAHDADQLVVSPIDHSAHTVADAAHSDHAVGLERLRPRHSAMKIVALKPYAAVLPHVSLQLDDQRWWGLSHEKFVPVWA